LHRRPPSQPHQRTRTLEPAARHHLSRVNPLEAQPSGDAYLRLAATPGEGPGAARRGVTPPSPFVGGAPRHARRRGAPDTHPPCSIRTKRVTGWSHRAMAAEAASVDHLAMATRDFRSTVPTAAPHG
jgi:hypothetical protein